MVLGSSPVAVTSVYVFKKHKVWPAFQSFPGPFLWNKILTKLSSVALEYFPLLLNIICCSWIFSVVLEYYLLLLNIIRFSWILFVVLEYYPLFLNTIRCFWILSVVLEYYPLFLNIFRCSWLLSVVLEYYPLFKNWLKEVIFSLNDATKYF